MRRSRLLLASLLFAASSLAACGDASRDATFASGAPSPTSARADDDAAQGEPRPVQENDFVETAKEKTSTFAVDVDTASYSIMRREVTEKRLPDVTTVRPEEYVNYFTYGYPQPTDEHPFSVNLDAAPSKFGENLHLLRVGLQGRTVDPAQRKPTNLVFLVDVSGSMTGSDRIGLVKHTLTKLTEQLGPSDTLAIVTYAGRAATLLEPTPVTDKQAIIAGIERLTTGGSTNGAGGITRAYELAERTKNDATESRVVICTDGDFNVGLTGEPLVKLIEEKRDRGVTLTTLGYGSGNYNDSLMQDLANKGNGNYAYIDSQAEADRVVGIKLTGTIQVIAKDVKIQVELDPNLVARYRLIGYENRVMANEDFRNDRKDAGEIGAGHSVTAFYEVELTQAAKDGQAQGDLATVRLRYKAPQAKAEDQATELARGLSASAIAKTFEEAAPDLRFGASVVELSEILRRSKHSAGARFDDVIAIAGSAAGQDKDRLELVTLAQSAKSLWR